MTGHSNGTVSLYKLNDSSSMHNPNGMYDITMTSLQCMSHCHCIR